MPETPLYFSKAKTRQDAAACVDEVIGNILSGWRYDISGISPAMRTHYVQHLAECGHCRRRQRIARTIDLLLMSVSTLSIFAFLLAAIVLHRIELITHIGTVHVELHHTAIAISLEAAAFVGLLFSSLLWILVAIATPIPGFVGSLLQEHIPADIRERFTKKAA